MVSRTPSGNREGSTWLRRSVSTWPKFVGDVVVAAPVSSLLLFPLWLSSSSSKCQCRRCRRCSRCCCSRCRNARVVVVVVPVVVVVVVTLMPSSSLSSSLLFPLWLLLSLVPWSVTGAAWGALELSPRTLSLAGRRWRSTRRGLRGNSRSETEAARGSVVWRRHDRLAATGGGRGEWPLVTTTALALRRRLRQQPCVAHLPCVDTGSGTFT